MCACVCVYVRVYMQCDCLSSSSTKELCAERGSKGVNDSLETMKEDSPHCVPLFLVFVGSGSQQAN